MKYKNTHYYIKIYKNKQMLGKIFRKSFIFSYQLFTSSTEGVDKRFFGK